MQAAQARLLAPYSSGKVNLKGAWKENTDLLVGHEDKYLIQE